MGSRENFLIQVMNFGFEKAAHSFSMLINRPVKIMNSESILIRHDDELPFLSEEQGDVHVLITQIVGEISGTSFLIFSQEESKEIFKTLGASASNQALNEAFLLEIDNIISASVITELSNALNLRIYGDVPKLFKVNSKELIDFMNTKINKGDPSSMIFGNTTFQFDNQDKVHPQFIWKISRKIFDMVPGQYITV